MFDQFIPFYACLMANYGKKLIIFVILAISLSEKSMRQIQNHYKYVPGSYSQNSIPMQYDIVFCLISSH